MKLEIMVLKKLVDFLILVVVLQWATMIPLCHLHLLELSLDLHLLLEGAEELLLNVAKVTTIMVSTKDIHLLLNHHSSMHTPAQGL